MKAEKGSENSGEKYSSKEVYEHLFPGNDFNRLPLISGQGDLEVSLKILSAWGEIRNINLGVSSIYNKTYAERENLKSLSRVNAGYVFNHMTPHGVATHPVCYNGNSFTDLVDTSKGEKLGGVVLKPIRKWSPPGTLIDRVLGVNPYFDQPEIVIGVLDKNNHPAALIHFIEGTEKRIPSRAEVRKAKRSFLTEPSF